MERILVLKGQDSAVGCLATVVWAVLMVVTGLQEDIRLCV